MNTYAALNLCRDAPLFCMASEEGAPIPGGIGRFAFQSSSNLFALYARMAEPEARER